MKKYFSLKKEKKTLSVQKTDQHHLTTMTGRFPFTLKVSFDLFFFLLQATVLYLDFLKSIFLKELLFILFMYLESGLICVYFV